MELRQLKYFTRSAELLNFTEAAKSLYISQSTLSQQVKQLEEELGMLLFDRIGKKVQLTEAGRLFLTYARQTLADAESGRHAIDDLKGLVTGEITIGATYGLSALLTQTIALFTKKYPQIKIIVSFGTSEELLEKLSAAQVDFVLSFLPLQHNKRFTSHTLFASPLMLVASKKSSVAGHKSIQLKELEQLPLALPGKGFNTRKLLDRFFEKNQVHAAVRMELNDITTLLTLVASGNWCTIMTVAAAKNMPGLVCIPIKNLNEKIKANVAWVKDAYRKKSVAAFIDMIPKDN